MERLQRHFARYIQGLYVRTSSTAVVASLNLWSMRGYIDKLKLLLLGRLCNLPSNCILKRVFLIRLCCGALGSCIHPYELIPDFIAALKRYNLVNILMVYVNTMRFPETLIWKRIVNDEIRKYKFMQYRVNVENNNQLIRRFGEIHILHSFHPCWYLSRKYKHISAKFGFLVLLSMIKLRTDIPYVCTQCEKQDCDIVKHLILDCEKLIPEREKLFDDLVSVMDVSHFVCFHDQPEEIILEGLLGGTNNVLHDMDPTDWEIFMCTSATAIFKFKCYFPVPLF